MNPFQTGLYRTAIVVALSAAALAAAAPATAAAPAEPAAAHDHNHAATKPTTPESGVATPNNMMMQMQTMHAKVMAAKTPAERAALMPAQMAMMQSCMDMMQSTQKSAGGDATAQRMDMMQMMMQMMMDRMSMPMAMPAKPDNAK